MTKAIIKSLAVLGALAISTSAYAAPFKVTGDIKSGQTGHIKSADPKVQNTHVKAGAFELTAHSGDLDDFIAFCIDIEHNFKSPTNYNIVDGPTSLLPQISASVAQSVQALFNTSFSTLDLGNANQSAGFQLALWEVLFEEEGSGWDLGVGNFTVTGFGGAVSAANDMLAATWGHLDDGSKGDGYVNYELTWLQADGGGQNLVTMAVSPIPLPAAGPMLIFGLAGLGYVARRRKQAEA